MLERIIIDNFATIEHIEFDLGSALNIITGETGAGKSVLVQAISTALGGRADISMVRTGCDRAMIQITGTRDGEDVIISRELLSGGKSVSKLNGEVVSLSKLREFCSGFADIHGQYDNQQILDPDNHILITDSFDHASIAGDLDKLSELYAGYTKARQEYSKLLADEAEALRQQDFYRYEYDNITGLSLVSGEDSALASELDLMRNSERIYQAVQGSYSLLHEQEDSILSGLARCMNDLSAVSSFSDQLNSLSEETTDLYYRLEEISGDLRDIAGRLSFSEEDMDRVSARLSDIESAKRKYHRSVDEIIAYGRELEQKISIIDNYDDAKAAAKQKMDNAYAALSEQADIVSGIRHDNASRLEKNISSELAALEFANSDFRIDITRSDEIGPLGYDRVEFLISTNPGEPLRPLTRIASGGEISRIMLAFKRTIGDGDKLDTMIFDEIDTGISGRTALVVGKKLKEIAEHHQVVCITHLPQIAAYGDDNYQIVKDLTGGKSSTHIEHLDRDGKVRQIANLISGDSESESSLSAARDLIDNKSL